MYFHGKKQTLLTNEVKPGQETILSKTGQKKKVILLKQADQGTQNDSYNFRKHVLAYTLQSTLYVFNLQTLKKSMVWNLSNLLQVSALVSSRAQVYNIEG